MLQQQQAENPHKDIVGIIEVGGKIAAVSRDGYILYGDADGFVAKKAQGVSYFTGALAMWEKGADKLLLLGIQGGTNSTAHGYREILLAADGNLDMATLSLRRPGEEAPSSVEPSSEKDNRYVVTIGKHPLSSIIQVSDKILFAATTQYGLWSYKYREHEGMSVWNAED
ncbi:MAG: hypothetical protein LBK00_03300 [Treponema sp.]|nr:hypothetical protein [Treponema sp.]